MRIEKNNSSIIYNDMITTLKGKLKLNLLI